MCRIARRFRIICGARVLNDAGKDACEMGQGSQRDGERWGRRSDAASRNIPFKVKIQFSPYIVCVRVVFKPEFKRTIPNAG